MNSDQQQIVTILLVILSTVILLSAFSSRHGDSFVHPLTGQRDFVYLTREEQIQLGGEAAMEREREWGVLQNSWAQQRVRRIGRRIVQALQRLEREKQHQIGQTLNWSDFPFQFEVLNIAGQGDDCLACSLPGGYILVTRGFLNFQFDDHELAAVLAHEVSHVVLRHGAKWVETWFMKKNLILWVIRTILGSGQLEIFNVAKGVAYILELSYSREQEKEADHLGYVLSCLASYDPRAVIRSLERIKKIAPAIPEYLQDHPLPQTRIEYVKDLTCALPAW